MKESLDCDCGICSICNGLRLPNEEHTLKPSIASIKQHCTQCEIGQQNLNLISDKKDVHVFCSNCKEKDCVVSSDGTCAMIRKYLSQKAEVERLKGEKQIILNRIKKFMADHYAEREKDFDKGCALAYAVCVIELERTPEELQKLLDNEVTK